MKKILAALFCSFTIFSAAVSAQNTDEEDVVKITSKLVQLDVVVTDSKGNQVTDLKSSDFTILQDGKPQTISGFTYVPLVTPQLHPPQPQRSRRRTNDRPPRTFKRSVAWTDHHVRC